MALSHAIRAFWCLCDALLACDYYEHGMYGRRRSIRPSRMKTRGWRRTYPLDHSNCIASLMLMCVIRTGELLACTGADVCVVYMGVASGATVGLHPVWRYVLRGMVHLCSFTWFVVGVQCAVFEMVCWHSSRPWPEPVLQEFREVVVCLRCLTHQFSSALHVPAAVCSLELRWYCILVCCERRVGLELSTRSTLSRWCMDPSKV